MFESALGAMAPMVLVSACLLLAVLIVLHMALLRAALRSLSRCRSAAMAAAFVLLCVVPAHAADIGPVRIDLSPLVPSLASLVIAVLATVAMVFARFLLAKFDVPNRTALLAQFDALVRQGAGEAYRQALLHGHDLAIPAGQNAAIAIAANYVLSHGPEVLQQLGITPERVSGAAGAEIGHLLGVDPTVSVAGTSIPMLAAPDTHAAPGAAQPAPPALIPVTAIGAQPGPAGA